MEAIYKQNLLNKLCDACGQCAHEENAMRSTHPSYNAMKCSVYKLISEMPSTEEDNTCGEWLDIKLEFGIRSYKCSICNHLCQAHSLKTFDPPPYCMFCGSRMINGRDIDAEIR
jgi:hypothetical protein